MLNHQTRGGWRHRTLVGWNAAPSDATTSTTHPRAVAKAQNSSARRSRFVTDTSTHAVGRGNSGGARGNTDGGHSASADTAVGPGAGGDTGVGPGTDGDTGGTRGNTGGSRANTVGVCCGSAGGSCGGNTGGTCCGSAGGIDPSRPARHNAAMVRSKGSKSSVQKTQSAARMRSHLQGHQEHLRVIPYEQPHNISGQHTHT